MSNAIDNALEAMRHANPVPDQVDLADAMLRSSVFLTATKETSMSIDADQPTHETVPSTQSGRRRNLLVLVGGFAVVVVVGAALLLTTGDGDDPAAASPPASVLADYLVVWNSEDAEAVMVFYTEDAVIQDHPSDPDGLATGQSEILVIETWLDGFQGSTGTMEFLNMEGSDDTVTFDNIMVNGSGECFSSTGSVMTVEGDKIALIVWGDPDGELC